MSFQPRFKSAWVGAVIVLAGACACDSSEREADEGAEARAIAAEGEPLAKVGDRVITTGDVERRLEALSPYERARYNSREQKQRLVDNMIRLEVLAQAAEERGFDEHPDVVRAANELMIQHMMRDFLAEEVAPDAISEDELRAFYEEQREAFHRPEQVRVSAIVTGDRGRAEQLAAEAEDASPREFRDLVEAHSIDADSRDRGGDLGYFSRGEDELPEPVVEAAFELGDGDATGVIDGGDGTYYVLARTGFRPAVERDFEDVRRQVRSDYERKAREEARDRFIGELREEAEVEIDDAALAEVEIPAGGPAAGSSDRSSERSEHRVGEGETPGALDELEAPPEPAPEPGGEPGERAGEPGGAPAGEARDDRDDRD